MDIEPFPTKRAPPKDREIPDAELVERICSGDRKAEEYLFCERLKDTVAYLSRRYRYEDLPGVLYLHLREDEWRRLRTWRGGSTLVTWVKTVGGNLCLSQTRTLKAQEVPDVLAPDMHPSPPVTPEAALLAAYDHATLLRGIELLKEPRDRLVLRWLAFQGRSVEEIAKELGLEKASTYVVISRAIARLRKVIENDIEE